MATSLPDIKARTLNDLSMPLSSRDKTWLRSISRFLRSQPALRRVVRSLIQSQPPSNSTSRATESQSRAPVAFSRSRQSVSIPTYEKFISNENESYCYRMSPERETNASTSCLRAADLRICDTCKASINWYFGSLTRQVTEILLHNQPIGTFIVRSSSSRFGNFALSVRVNEDEQRPTGVAHYLLVKSAKSRVQIKGFKSDFDCVQNLLIYHSTNPELLPCKLRFHDIDLSPTGEQLPYHERLRLLAMTILTRC